MIQIIDINEISANGNNVGNDDEDVGSIVSDASSNSAHDAMLAALANLQNAGIISQHPAPQAPPPSGFAKVRRYIKWGIIGSVGVSILLLSAVIIIPTGIAFFAYSWIKEKITGKVLSIDIPSVVSKEEWLSLGYSDFTASNLERIEKQLLHFVRYGKLKDGVWQIIGDASIDIYASEENNNTAVYGRIIPYHAKLQPFWEAFAQSLPQWYANGETVNFAIRDYELKSVVLDTLLPSVQNLNSKELDIIRTGSGFEGVNFISSVMSVNTSLENVTFMGDTIRDVDAAMTFSTAISNSSLKIIELSKCDLGNDESVLSAILEGCRQVKLEALVLRENSIASSCVPVIADYIASNAAVDALHLESNLIADEDVAELVLAIQTSTNMKQLYLEKNRLSQVGNHQLMTSLLDTSDLTSIVDSNHTCKLFLTNNRSSLRWVNKVNKKKCDVEEKIKHKIGLTLDKLDDAGRLFANVPTELTHYALALVTKGEDLTALNRIYKARQMIASHLSAELDSLTRPERSV